MRWHVPSLALIALLVGGCGTLAAAPAASVPHTGPSQATSAADRAPAAAGPMVVHYRGQVVILMYHGLGPKAHGDIITPAAFAAEISAMRHAGFEFVSLSQVAAFLAHRKSLPPNAVALTFDDGLASVYTYAYPILLHSRVPFACFLIGGRVGRDPADVSWRQVQDMERSGLATFGSHTMNSHGSVPVGPNATGPALVSRIYYASTGRMEAKAAFRARIRRDLASSATLISMETKRPVYWFAYPFGAYTPEVERLLEATGYHYAVTTWGWGTTIHARPLALPRINAGTPRTSGSSIVSTVLYIAGLTAHAPRLQPPPAEVPIWR